MKQQRFYAGIDGGGSKTCAIIVDSLGHERGHGFAGSSNYAAVGLEQTLSHIHTALEQAIQQVGCSLFLEAAWFGLAGVDRPADHTHLFPHLRSFATAVRLTNDAELILSSLKHTMGVAIIVGTGSIVLGRDTDGNTVRAGGWGHLIGDEGSGYAIGRTALQAAVRSADGRGPETCLLDMILQHWHLQEPSNIIGKVYPNADKASIAQLSQLVFSAARSNDLIARNIVEEAASEIALAAVAVSKKLSLPSSIPLALAGSLLTHEADFRTMVLNAIRQHLAIAPVVVVDQPALSAATYLSQTICE
jgi:glucosamine kinase